MASTANLDRARQKAQQVLQEQRLTQPEDINLHAIANNKAILIKPAVLIGVEGWLIRHRDFGIICYRADVAERGRKRFTIAHELGHWELHPSQSQAQICTVGDIHGYKGSPMELEANAFAAELLMPSFMLKPCTKYSSLSVNEVIRISEMFDTTLTATAVRLLDELKETSFVVFSKNNTISWWKQSPKARGLFIAKNKPIHGDTFAFDCETEIDEARGMNEVSSEAWFPESRFKHRMRVWEESVLLGNYDVVMSLITVSEE